MLLSFDPARGSVPTCSVAGMPAHRVSGSASCWTRWASLGNNTLLAMNSNRRSGPYVQPKCSQGQRRGGRRRSSASPAPLQSTPGSTEEFQAQLDELLSLPEAQLPEWVEANRQRLGFRFMAWLSDQAEEQQGAGGAAARGGAAGEVAGAEAKGEGGGASAADAAATAAVSTPKGPGNAKEQQQRQQWGQGGAGAEGAAQGGGGGERLWWLGSRLTVLLEGLEPESYDRVQSELQAAAEKALAATSSSSSTSSTSSSRQLEEGEEDGNDGTNIGGEGGGGGGGGSGGSLAHFAGGSGGGGDDAMELRRRSLAALSPEGIAFLMQKVADLGDGMRERQAAAVVELIGRKRAEEVDEWKIGRTDVAVRILEFLLTVEGREQRAALLEDAFDPGPQQQQQSGGGGGGGRGDEEEGEGGDEDAEQLFTTPLQLLQAVDLYVSRLAAPSEAASPLKPPPMMLPPAEEGVLAADVRGPGGVLRALAALREDILAGGWVDGDLRQQQEQQQQ